MTVIDTVSGGRNRLEAAETVERFLPLYEAKMLHLYDDQWATYEPDGDGGYTSRLVTPEEKDDPTFHVLPRYWVPASHVAPGFRERWFGYRNISNVTNERTILGTFVGPAAANNSVLVVTARDDHHALLLAGIWSSFVFDYVARQKVGGTNMTFNYVRQFAAPGPALLERFGASIADSVQALSANLAHAQGIPSTARSRSNRTALDAIMASAYGLSRSELAYILDTFPIVRRKDLATHGEYRTKRLILEAYDRLISGALGVVGARA